MSPSEHDDRLPPPAFPSGIARARPASPTEEAERSKGEGMPEGAVISPEAPLERAPRLDDAFIPPDAPVVRDGPVHPPEDYETVMHREGDDEVVVTGIGSESSVPEGDEVPLDPYLERVVTELEALVEALRRKGEAGLRTEPEMSRFETTLRGYCMGYLAALQDAAPEAESDFD